MQLFFVSEKGHLIKINKFDFKTEEVYVVDDDKTIYLWFGQDAPDSKKKDGILNARKLDYIKEGAAKILMMDQNNEYGAFLAMMDALRDGVDAGGTIVKRPEMEELKKDEEKYVRYYLVETLHNVIDDMKDPRYKFEKIPESFIQEQLNDIQFKDVREIHWDIIKNQLETKLQMALERIEEERETKLGATPWLEEEEAGVEEEEVGLGEEINLAAYFISREGYTYDELCWLLAEKVIQSQKGRKDVPADDIRRKAEEVFKSSCTYDELCWLNAEMIVLIEKKYIEIE